MSTNSAFCGGAVALPATASGAHVRVHYPLFGPWEVVHLGVGIADAEREGGGGLDPRRLARTGAAYLRIGAPIEQSDRSAVLESR
jgi:hypothetical protein